MVNHDKNQPMYGWALGQDGKPVPIAKAKRGERYTCPICHGDVVAKLGDIKQHHFAHINLLQCTPDNVARAVAGLWIADELAARLAQAQPVYVSWKINIQDHINRVDILKEVATIAQKREDIPSDIALLDANGKPKTFILLGIDTPAPPSKIAEWTGAGITVITLNPAGVRSGVVDLETLLAQSTVFGGWWIANMPPELVMQPAEIREILKDSVVRPPHRFFAELQDSGSMTHILEVGTKKLWLPPELWHDVVGGTHNKLGTEVDVVIQEWAEPDSGHIALFYITAHQTNAIGIRRYPPGETVVVKLDTSAFRLERTTALDLAMQMIGKPIELPR